MKKQTIASLLSWILIIGFVFGVYVLIKDRAHHVPLTGSYTAVKIK